MISRLFRKNEDAHQRKGSFSFRPLFLCLPNPPCLQNEDLGCLHMYNQRLKSTLADTTHVLICAAAVCIISTLTSELICIQAEAALLYSFFFFFSPLCSHSPVVWLNSVLCTQASVQVYVFLLPLHAFVLSVYVFYLSLSPSYIIPLPLEAAACCLS